MLQPVMTWRSAAAILLFNAALSFLVQAAAPDQPRLTDRNDYEYTGRRPFAPGCPNTIYCYRILVPVALELLPLDPETRWRGAQWLAHTATGTVMSIVAASFASPFIAAILLQTSYAFSFTAYDPYTPDPVVFLIAALILWTWMHDRPLLAAVISAIGVFAKETVGVLAACVAVAALLSGDRQDRRRWLVPVASAAILLFGFHWYMDTYNGWGIARNPAASFSTGSWLALWFKNNPSHTRKALMLFSPFAFGWIYAVAGYRHAPRALRDLALATILPIAALVYVQTPERALGNAFFVVVPLAAAFLAQVPRSAAWAAAITNGLVTAKIGLSTTWLPSSTVLLIPAAAAAAWAFASYARNRDKIPST
jgi:hypothetical protein